MDRILVYPAEGETGVEIEVSGQLAAVLNLAHPQWTGKVPSTVSLVAEAGLEPATHGL